MNATARLSTTKPELLELDQMRLISEAIHVAAALGVADLLAAGPKNADELSKATGTSAPSLRRVMRALASFVIFSHDSADRFALTPLGEFLKRDMPGVVAPCRASFRRRSRRQIHRPQARHPLSGSQCDRRRDGYLLRGHLHCLVRGEWPVAQPRWSPASCHGRVRAAEE